MNLKKYLISMTIKSSGSMIAAMLAMYAPAVLVPSVLHAQTIPPADVVTTTKESSGLVAMLTHTARSLKLTPDARVHHTTLYLRALTPSNDADEIVTPAFKFTLDPQALVSTTKGSLKAARISKGDIVYCSEPSGSIRALEVAVVHNEK